MLSDSKLNDLLKSQPAVSMMRNRKVTADVKFFRNVSLAILVVSNRHSRVVFAANPERFTGV